MSTLAHPVGVPAGSIAAELSVTWTVTKTYTSRLPTGPVAAALGLSIAELTANPAQLRRAIPDSLADWLAAEYQDADHVMGEPQVEITAATSPDAAALRDLINAARAAIRAEADTGPLSDTGQALTALLARACSGPGARAVPPTIPAHSISARVAAPRPPERKDTRVMNLGEFVLNETAARDWLTNIVTNRDRERFGGPPPAWPGIGPAPHLAEALTPSGTPGHSGADTAALLSAALTTAGVITAPLDTHAAVDAVAADSHRYRWFVTAGAPTGRGLLVASEPLSAPTLLNPLPGVDALLAVLTDAVQQANQLLRQVESFSAPHFAEAARAVEANLVVGQGTTTDCGCGWPITEYDEVWLHVYNPELTGSDDHDAQP